MKSLGIAIGLAALLGLNSANAAVVYDTITGIPTGSDPVEISTGSVFTPMGSHFKASDGEQITSVTVRLSASGSLGTGNLTDAGSVLVYLVPGVSGLPGTTGPSPRTLLNPLYVGTILDTSVVMGTATNLTVTPSHPINLTKGNWWLVLTSGSDPNNFYQTINSVDSTAEWETQSSLIALANGAIGVPAGGINAVTASASGLIPYLAPNTADREVFMMQIVAEVPEPASFALLGAGLAGLGLSRLRRAKKSSP